MIKRIARDLWLYMIFVQCCLFHHNRVCKKKNLPNSLDKNHTEYTFTNHKRSYNSEMHIAMSCWSYRVSSFLELQNHGMLEPSVLLLLVVDEPVDVVDSNYIQQRWPMGLQSPWQQILEVQPDQLYIWLLWIKKSVQW